jgi:hypothetical protein
MAAPWSKLLFEKLIVTQLLKKFPSFMEPKGSLLWMVKEEMYMKSRDEGGSI